MNNLWTDMTNIEMGRTCKYIDEGRRIIALFSYSNKGGFCPMRRSLLGLEYSILAGLPGFARDCGSIIISIMHLICRNCFSLFSLEIIALPRLLMTY